VDERSVEDAAAALDEVGARQAQLLAVVTLPFW
jgi:hypothetical protein